MLIVTVVPEDTVPEPSKFPPVDASYTLTVSLLLSPDNCTVSEEPALLVTVISSLSKVEVEDSAL